MNPAIPFGGKTVTLLHRSGGGYVRHALTGCSWRMGMARTMDGNTAVRPMTVTCRIPRDQQGPIPGDLLILGDVDAPAADEIALVRLMDSLRAGGVAAFRASSVQDNDGPIPHWAARGDAG